MLKVNTTNPFFYEEYLQVDKTTITDRKVITLYGTIQKTALLLFIAFSSSLIVWKLILSGNFNAILNTLFVVSIIVSILLALVIGINKEYSPYLSPIIAISTGLAMGGLFVKYNEDYPGLFIQAFLLTYSISAFLLISYLFRIIKVYNKKSLFFTTGMIGLLVFYILSLTLNNFNIKVPYLHDNSFLGLLFCLYTLIFASKNLVKDYQFIFTYEYEKDPKYMEWYFAVGLLFSNVWLYFEVLMFIIKIKKYTKYLDIFSYFEKDKM